MTMPRSAKAGKAAHLRPPTTAPKRTSSTTPLIVDRESYWFLSTRPLHTLAFLAPLLALYEVGTLFFLSGNGLVEVIRARLMLSQVMDVFGAAGFHLPPILLSVILLCWHVLERDKWVLRKDVVLGMALESFVWTLPLFVFAAIAGTSQTLIASPNAPAGALPLASHPPALLAQVGGTTPVEQLSLAARMVLALGAGVYEELLFRLILIVGLHFVLKDLLKISESTTYVIAAVVSAIAFTLYHNIQHPTGGADLRLLVIYMIAGLYFAVLFILRGFGVTVATHACYDVIALSLLGRS